MMSCAKECHLAYPDSVVFPIQRLNRCWQKWSGARDERFAAVQRPWTASDRDLMLPPYLGTQLIISPNHIMLVFKGLLRGEQSESREVIASNCARSCQ